MTGKNKFWDKLNDGDNNLSAAMRPMAQMLWAFYGELVNAGFSEEMAMRLVEGKLLTNLFSMAASKKELDNE